MKDTPDTPPPKSSMTLNWEDWLPFFEDDGISSADKRKTIEALWFVMKCFADMPWKAASAAETSGKDCDLTAVIHQAVLNSKSTSKEEA